jgi:hypothetical protein
MKLIIILLTLVTFGYQLNAQSTDKQAKELYPIIENGLWGFIDKSGKVKIEPKFRSSGQFSEGLAPVRLNGTYGYINTTGDFIIQPKYDVAYSFDQRQAKVYVDSKPYYIDKDGEYTFEHNFTEIYGFEENDYSIVSTKTKNYGIINKQGKLLVDTIFKKISPFSDGLAIVIGQNHEPYPDDERAESFFEMGVINLDGDFLIPFGEFKSIELINGGYFLAERYSQTKEERGWTHNDAVIDSGGNHIFNLPAGKFFFDSNAKGFHDNLAIVEIKNNDKKTKNDYYSGVINKKGEILFSNKNWERMSPFVLNRSFVKEVDGDWWLINNKGETVNKKPYVNILSFNYKGEPEYIFQNGIHYVETTEGWITIDTNGIQIMSPKELDYHVGRLTWRGQIIFTEEDISVQSDRYSFQYGFWDTKSGVVIDPQFHDISFSEFTDDLIYVMQDDCIGYIDHQGNYVWREEKKEQQNLDRLNIDYMNRGYFYSSSPYKQELAGYGGWGGSGNDFQKVSESNKLVRGKLNMMVNPDDKEKYRETYEGMKMYVANASKDTFYFDAQDSRLYLKIQAQDRNGKWKDIEYLPSSSCGNSYHSLFLPPTHYWEFVIPLYEGEFKTKLRAELLYKKDNDQKNDDILYSNEFDGSINPGQFWRKNPYYPSGLMDPYND